MLKRLLYKLIVGLATFALSLSLTSIWNTHGAISLCELNANPSLYAGKTVRFRAVVQRTQKFILATSICDVDTATASAGIELNPNEVAKFTLPVSTIASSGEGDRIYLMDAMIVGQLDSHFGMGCFGPKYHISNASVERVFSVQEFEHMPQALEWLISTSY
jgi:hypothetical protein